VRIIKNIAAISTTKMRTKMKMKMKMKMKIIWVEVLF